MFYGDSCFKSSIEHIKEFYEKHFLKPLADSFLDVCKLIKKRN